jgi:hypothetical protein
MIPIKIQCGCGQRYAFEVEPVGDRLLSPVACPVCGADGTAAANEVIAQSLAARPITIPAAHVPLHVAPALSAESQGSAAAPVQPVAPRRVTRLPGQVERPQAVYEARAKISWGDPPQEVLKFLMIQGFSYEEASELVQGMFRERAATIRGKGILKIVLGAFLLCVPIATWLTFLSIGLIFMKLFAVAIMVGIWGGWNVLHGIFMVMAPKSEAGDVAEH